MNAPAFGFAKPARPLDISRFVTEAQRVLRDEDFSGAANDTAMILRALQAAMDASADPRAAEQFVASAVSAALDAAGYVILSRSKQVVSLFVMLARQFQRETTHG